MPAARESSDDEEPAQVPNFIDDDSHTVGFLELTELTVDQVMEAILRGFSQLGTDAVLTAYCNTVDRSTLTELGEAHGVELVHSVSHGAGTTFVLKRSRRR